jgi:polyisoprenoid-binding protein YceI
VSTTTPVTIPAGMYSVDPSHSSVAFEVKHMGIATVRGEFRTFQGTLEANDETLSLQGTVDVASIDTRDEGRDGHLKSPEFFDVEQQPQITFHSTTADVAESGAVQLTGEITIKGITKPIELTGTVAENGEDPWGNQRVGVEVEGRIDRREFDLKWNQTLPNGDVLVSNTVKLVVSVSAVKAA